MQDTLYLLIRRSYEDLYTFFEWYIPDKVEIISVNNVINTFADK